MENRMKKVLSILLCVLLLCMLMPQFVFAEDPSGKTEISEITFSVTLPEAGTAVTVVSHNYTPGPTITVPAEAGYELGSKFECIYYDPANTSLQLSTLAAGNMCMVYFDLQPKEGYQFASQVNVSCSSGGTLSEAETQADGENYAVMWLGAIPTTGEEIGSVSLSLTPPTGGTTVSVTSVKTQVGLASTQKPETGLAAASGANYTVSLSAYYTAADSLGEYFKGTYKAGDTFYVMAMLKPAEGYIFADDIGKEDVTVPDGITVENVYPMNSQMILILSGKVAPAPVHTHDGVTFDTMLDSSFTGGTLAGGNYYLTEDLALTKPIAIAAGETVNLCLNGHTIDVQKNGHGFSVNGTLTLCDCSTAGSVTAGESAYGGGAYVYDGGSMTLKSGSLTANRALASASPGCGGGVYVEAGGSFTMTGGSIESCMAAGSGGGEGSGVYVEAGGSFTMTGGSITNCTISGSQGSFCGAVYVASGSSVTLGGSAKITGNLNIKGTKRTESKSNLYIANGAAVTVASGAAAPGQGMKVGVTAENTANCFTGTCEQTACSCFFSDADTLHVEYDGTKQALKLASGHVHDGITFDQTLSSSFTGGDLQTGSYYLTANLKLTEDISVSDGSVNLCLNGHVLDLNGYTLSVGTQLTICDCSSGGAVKGGKVSVRASGSLTLNSGTIQDGSAEEGGGVCVATQGSFTMNGGSITGCTATGDGGAVYVAGGGTFTMTGGTITGNTAGGNGGGVSSFYGTFTMTGGTITGNTATGNGGGVFRECGSCSIKNGTITGNTAGTGGGVYSEALTLGGTTKITGNTGGNLYLLETITLDAPASGMEVGLTMHSGTGTFTGANTADYSAYFTADPSGYIILCGADNALTLRFAIPTADDFTFTPPSNLVYDGTEKTAQFTTALSGIGTLTLKYYSNGKLLSGAPKDVGSYTVELDVAQGTTFAAATGICNTYWTFTILPRSIAAATAGEISRQIYTGSPFTPTLTLKYGDTVLVQDVDYTVSYRNNTNAGAAAVCYTGTGNFKDSGECLFTILPASTWTAEEFTLTYVKTGNALEPKPVVKFGDKTLTEGEDYLLTYSGNLEAGTASVTIEGTGNYGGVATLNFTIKELADVVTLSDLGDFTAGQATKDAVITLGEGTVLKCSDLKRVLVDGTALGTDAYKAEEGCIKVTLYKAYLNTLQAGTHTLTVELGGDYDGQKYETTFTVKANKISPQTGVDTTAVTAAAAAFLAVLGTGAAVLRRKKQA